MKYYYLLISTLLLLGCTGNHVDNSLRKLVEERSGTDTTLTFQGFTIGAKFDSAKIDSIKSVEPITIVTKNNDKYEFIHFDASENREYVSTGKYEYISVSNEKMNTYDFFELIRLYMEHYGQPSYFTIFEFPFTSFGQYLIGEVVEPNKIVFDAQSAINMMLEDKNDDHSFQFAWEWKNQSIFIKYCRKLSVSPYVSIMYCNTGDAERKTKEAKEKANQDAKKATEERELESIRNSQQI